MLLLLWCLVASIWNVYSLPSKIVQGSDRASQKLEIDKTSTVSSLLETTTISLIPASDYWWELVLIFVPTICLSIIFFTGSIIIKRKCNRKVDKLFVMVLEKRRKARKEFEAERKRAIKAMEAERKLAMEEEKEEAIRRGLERIRNKKWNQRVTIEVRNDIPDQMIPTKTKTSQTKTTSDTNKEAPAVREIGGRTTPTLTSEAKEEKVMLVKDTSDSESKTGVTNDTKTGSSTKTTEDSQKKNQ